MDAERFFSSCSTRAVLGDVLLLGLNIPIGRWRQTDDYLLAALKRFSDDTGLYEALPSLSLLIEWANSKSFHDFLRYIAADFPAAADELRRRGAPLNAESATPARAALLNAVNS
jgi:hypothetical protein